MDIQNINRIDKPYIAVAIDNTEQRSRIAATLMPFYELGIFSNTSRTLAGCRARQPFVIIVGEKLPTNNGYDFVHMLRLDAILAAIPVVIMVAKDDALTRNAVTQCGAQGHLINFCSPKALISMVSNLLNNGIQHQWQTLPATAKQALIETLDLFAGIATNIGNSETISYESVSNACKPLVEAVTNNNFRDILQGVKHHDDYTYAHSVRVATFLTFLGGNIGLSKDEQVILASGGLLHDVGKMSIPNDVLNKAGRLTTAECAVMKTHVNASITYLQDIHDLPTGILIMAAQHHEKLDGTGYPNGLAGNNLNRLARIASIVDVFSALTDRRVYKPALDAETALKLMVNEMASHLDMTLLGLFREMLLDVVR